jgi:hypothetical protein
LTSRLARFAPADGPEHHSRPAAKRLLAKAERLRLEEKTVESDAKVARQNNALVEPHE